MSETLLQKIDRIEKEILLLKNKPRTKYVEQVKQIDYSQNINNLNNALNKTNKELIELKGKSVLKNEKQALQIEREIESLKNDINKIKESIKNKKEIDLIGEIKRMITVKFVTNLYRNK